MAEKTPPDKNDVDDQLEYLFAEAESEGAGRDLGPQNGPLRELKAIFLAVDWEINDDIMSALLRQIEVLKSSFKDDRIITLFLQLLGAVGKYIKANKANAHPDAVKLLHSIYTSLEIVSISEEMTEAARKKILRREVDRFQQLKETVGRKSGPAASGSRQAPEAGGPRPGDVPPALAYLLKEIRKTIREEFAALRAEIGS